MSYRARHYHLSKNIECGFNMSESHLYFNSGVMWVRDTELTHKLYDGWHSKWCSYSQNTVMEDQPGLNETNKEMGYVIHRLSDLYNVQVSTNPFPTNYLANAKILHVFHNDPDSTYIMSFKENKVRGINDPLVMKVLDDPKAAFYPGTMLRKDDVREVLLETKHFFAIRRFYQKHPKMFMFNEKLISFCLKARVFLLTPFYNLKHKKSNC